uniref:Uncharacterized protein n=1 Tax=Arundo donax TaxID=35708 RepID=A0A0A8XZZ3_ARUDO
MTCFAEITLWSQEPYCVHALPYFLDMEFAFISLSVSCYLSNVHSC